MNPRIILSLSIITALGFALPGSGFAQQKSLKDQIVGSWTLVQAVDTHADGTKTNPWGANPKGAYMFKCREHRQLCDCGHNNLSVRSLNLHRQNRSSDLQA